jgi:hypothetical protein
LPWRRMFGRWRVGGHLRIATASAAITAANTSIGKPWQ